MKRNIKRLRVGLVALLLMIGLGASAQPSVKLNTPGTLQPPLSGTGTEAIFVHGGNGFKLTATTTSTAVDGVAGEAFVDFTWLIRNALGGGDGISSITSATAVVGGTVKEELTVTNLAPGFYTFIAQGITANEICSSAPEEFTVFVLPPLSVSVTSSLTENEYCADDLPTAGTLTATTSFNLTQAFNTQTNLTSENPTITDFELRYRWYKVAAGTSFDVGTATPTSSSTSATNSSEDVYTLSSANDAAVGSWNYYVAVDYTVKSAGVYHTALGGATPTVIKVTPKPGKPTITIQAIN